MERREFIAGAGLTGAAMTALGVTAEEKTVEREYYEHRIYQLLPGDRNGAIHAFLEQAAIPAWNRAGIGPVGVFTGVYGGEWTRLEVLLPHASLASYAAAGESLALDEEFQKAGAAFLNTPASDPNFVRYETNLMVAFSGMPKLKAPEKKDRIFELRTYESHSEKFAKKKIEMFNTGGEIEIFLEVGLRPVFFGETIAGARMPNLTYMMAFDDQADHDTSWARFVGAESWKVLGADPQYKDTVSNIHNRIMKPTVCSQI